MVATTSRIGFVLEPYRRAVSQTAAAASRHGNLARESADPIDSYFANVSDAQIRADERQSLLSPERRLLSIQISGVDLEPMMDLIDAREIMTVRVKDEERGIDRRMIVTESIIDIGEQVAILKVWG